MNPNDPLYPDHSVHPVQTGGPEFAPAEAGMAVDAIHAPQGSPQTETGRTLQETSSAMNTADAAIDAGVDREASPLSGDAPMAEPGDASIGTSVQSGSEPELPTLPGPKTAAAHTWDPEAVPAISAAKAAADFVAQIFADVAAPETTPVAPPATDEDAVVVPADATSAEPAEFTAPTVPDEPALRPAYTLVTLLQGQHILILGLGASGLAMARWCVRCGAQVTVADTRAAPPQLPLLQQEMPQVRFVSGAFDATLVDGQALSAVYRSPGLSPFSVAPVLVAASAYGISAGGELGLYSAALAALRASHAYAPAVLAITGTNGKTTVTSLTGQLVERAGQSVAVAGNIGPTLLDTLAAHLDADTLPEVWVLELSSFQLDGVTGFEPTAATVLNITQDHLDWHGDMDAYVAAKARVFGESGLMILNREDTAVMQMLPPPVRVKLQKPQVRTHLTFGGDMPKRPGDFGIEVVSGMPWLVRAMEADETRKRGRNDVEEELHIQRLMPADALRIRGRHNAVNALAALALASAAGASLAAMLYGLREYRGEPHRVESVGVVNGVEYFDDSKGTNVGATVAALTGLGAERRLVIILGGDGKGQDFAPLAAPVACHARAVVLIGRDAPLIRAALNDADVALISAETLPEAVGLAAERARAGDAVLMSPACASFDMFTGYEHRAQVFCDAVRELADAAGQSVEGLA